MLFRSFRVRAAQAGIEAGSIFTRFGELLTYTAVVSVVMLAVGAYQSDVYRSVRLAVMLDELRERGARIVVIDTPPHSAPAINAALEVAGSAVMVTRPNPMDLRALEGTWRIVQALGKPAAAVFTQTPPGTRARALALAQAYLDRLGVSHCPTPLTNTLSFPYAQAEALSVQEREPTSKARAEIAEVWSFLKRSAIV